MKAAEGKYAWTATVGTKGQIVIPKEARELFGIRPGDTLIILGDVKQGMAIPPKSAFSMYFEHIFGGAAEAEDEAEGGRDGKRKELNKERTEKVETEKDGDGKSLGLKKKRAEKGRD